MVDYYSILMGAVEKFERRLNLKEESTQKNYRAYFNKFLEKQGLTAEEFLQLAENDLDEVGLMVQEAMKAEIRAGRRATTARTTYKAVHFFLKAQGVKDFELDREDKPRMIYNGSHRVSRDQIKDFYDGFSQGYKERNRAILMVLKDSGLRISDVAQLDAEMYRRARVLTSKDDENIREGERFKVFRDPFATEKTGDFAHIHLGPEAIAAVDTYLGDREEGPLFLAQDGGRMASKAVSELFRLVKVRGRLKGDFAKISAHSLRKFFYTQLDLREDYLRWIQGKATSVYLDDPGDVTRQYIQKYDGIRVFGLPSQDRTELKRLKTELEESRAKENGRVAELEAKNAVIEAKLDKALKALEQIYDREKPKA